MEENFEGFVAEEQATDAVESVVEAVAEQVEETPAEVVVEGAETPVAETKPAELPKGHQIIDGVEYVKCNDCGELLPITEFYRVTKGGKVRQPCKNDYDGRYYQRRHGERKPKVAKPAGETPEPSADAAIAAVIEGMPEETPSEVPAVIEQVEQVEQVVEAPKKVRKSKKAAAQTPDETPAEVTLPEETIEG